MPKPIRSTQNREFIGMKQRAIRSAVLVAIMMTVGCATSEKQASAPKAAPGLPEGAQIVGTIAPGSKFAKVKLGMPQNQVHDLIGQPSDSKTYNTGKMWIPFYFGRDVMRLEEIYKSEGRITYTGAGIGGTHFTVYRIEVDQNEDGYAN
jgi:hypothetical protein